MRARSLAAIHLVLATFIVSGQSFDVVSVKPYKGSDQPTPLLGCFEGGRFVSSYTSVQAALQWAYDIQFFQITGTTPIWIKNPKDTYDIDARAGAPVSQAQCKLMVQALFMDRFKFKAHREMKELPGYALRVGNSKPKLQEAGQNDVVKINGNVILDENINKPKGWPMSKLAAYISGLPSLNHRPVVDQTGLTGVYRIDFRFAFISIDSNNTPDVRSAVRNQLGLKLETTKVPVEMLVIDHIERPDGN
jgi:uncharacterized protein (TIGR03435 family)